MTESLAAAAANPMKAFVVETFDDGGGIIEIPIAREAQSVDFSRTAGGGKKGRVTRADLAEMVENFALYPSPVGVSLNEHMTDRSGPQPAVIAGVSLKGGVLWGRIKLNASMYAEVVTEKLWHAFSIEAAKNLAKPTISFVGWVLRGGVFTNNSALDTVFAFAGSTDVCEATLSATTDLLTADAAKSEEGNMPNETKDESVEMAALTAKYENLTGKVEERDATITSLRDEVRQLGIKLSDGVSRTETAEASRDKANAEQRALKAELKTANDRLDASQANLSEVREKSRALEEKQLGDAVTRICRKHIRRGVPPTAFEGYEDDPAKFLTDNFVNLDAFKRISENMVADSRLAASTSKGTTSGRTTDSNLTLSEESDGDDSLELTADEAAALKKQGLDPKYAGYKDSSDVQPRT